jgi:excisionase family DNA binding protein
MTDPPVRVTVEDAAKLLGITVDAVRKRIERGTLKSEKVEGTRFVFLDNDMTQQDYIRTSPGDDMTALVASLQDQIRYLRQEAEDWKEEARRKDHIIMSLTQRIPELEPTRESPSDAAESPVTASEEEAKGQAPPEPETEELRPWWRRIFK